METTYKAVEFNKHDIVTRDLLDTMQSNHQWINDNTARNRYIQENGSVVDGRMIIVGGRVVIPRNKKSDTYTHKVSLGKAFAPECRPNVTTGIVSESDRKIFCVLNGIGTQTLPAANGFEVKVHVPESTGKWKIPKTFYVYWQAVGYRASGVNDF